MANSSDLYKGNDAFYRAYADYLVEDRVRKVHDAVLGAALLHPALQQVIDLGCGKENEFFYFGKPALYIGLDKNADSVCEVGHETIVADYRDTQIVKDQIKKHNLTAAISLFSVEITASREDNHAYYEELFRKTGIKAMLIGGFYYAHAKGQATVEETKGLVSYQTSGQIDRPDTSLFHETRIEIPCPSSLFGEDVFEVWRLLQRPEDYDPAVADTFAKLVPQASVSTCMAVKTPPRKSKAPKPIR